ncbi:PqqD family protein [Thermodesulfobacteriota bacterium]
MIPGYVADNHKKEGMMDNPRKRDTLEVDEFSDGYIVFDPENDKVHSLNPTAVFILELCNGNHSIEDIVSVTRDMFKLTESPEEDVQSVLQSFEEQGLLEQ